MNISFYLQELKKLDRKCLLNRLMERDEEEDLTDWANRNEAIRILLGRENVDDLLHFHFDRRLSVANIQLFAMLVKDMIAEQFCMSNSHLVDVELPVECNDLGTLYETCKTHRYDAMFYVSTPEYANVEYYTRQNVQIPKLEVMLYLKSLQNTFMQLKHDDGDISKTIRLGQNLSNSFMFLNNAIQMFFYYQADNNGEFVWGEKYGPCIINLDFIRQYNGQVITIEQQNQKAFETCRKYIFQYYAYQCRFLSFWSCLVTVATFPQLDDKSKETLNNLMDYLLKNYDSVFLYDIVVEGDCLKGSTPLSERGSADNTTRVKLYYTTETIEPCEMRLDLPHVDHPYAHLNIEQGEENLHQRISSNAEGEEYDHVYDDLVEALSLFDYFSTVCKHSPVADDRRILSEMKYRVALFNYSMSAYYYLLFKEFNIENYHEHSYYERFRLALYELLAEDSIAIDDAEKMNPEELLAYADMALRREGKL